MSMLLVLSICCALSVQAFHHDLISGEALSVNANAVAITRRKNRAHHLGETLVQVQSTVAAAATVDFGHPKWLELCKYIYLDVGSNKGVQTKKFFEPDGYPGSLALPLFDAAFGAPDVRTKKASDTHICVLGVEANPMNMAELKTLEEDYQARGWNVHFYNFAAGHHEGQVKFGIENNTQKDRPYQLGAQVLTGETHIPGAIASTEDVRQVDFGAFLKSLPANTVQLMKMDIEGGEWQVLPRMADMHLLCKDVIHALYMEVHNGFGDTEFWKGTRDQAGVQKFVSQQKCPKGAVDLSFVDDEAYADGVPVSRSTHIVKAVSITAVVFLILWMVASSQMTKKEQDQP